MILPTIIAISLDALAAVPRSYREGSLAMGATGWQTIWRVVLPAARSGMVAAVILGMGRAIGETMAVVMVAGNAVQLPHSPLDPLRTLTANLALEMGYAAADHRAALFATADPVSRRRDPESGSRGSTRGGRRGLGGRR